MIGAGAGGLVSSYIAAAVKARVTLIEAHKMGGDCLNYGCVPSKALIKSARVAKQMQQADAYGLEAATPRFSFRKVMARVHEVIRQVEPHDSVERYTRLGVEVLQGYATLVDPWTVEVRLSDGRQQRLTARSIVLATGASPVVPPLPGLDETGYVTSDTLWQRFAELDAPPPRLIVLGGGPIGCELAQSFARLGSQVTQIERGSRLMAREDAEVSTLVQDAMRADGVNILTDHAALRTELRDGHKYLICDHQGQEVELAFDQLLIAVGRQPRLTGYGWKPWGSKPNAPSSPTSIWKPSTPTSTPWAMWPGPTSLPIPPPTRPGTPPSTPCSASSSVFGSTTG